MSARGQHRIESGDDDFSLPIHQQAMLAAIHRRTVAELGTDTLEEGYRFAGHRLSGVVALTRLALCTTVLLYQETSNQGDETGGGIEYGLPTHDDPFGSQTGVRVRAYHLNGTIVQPEEPFTHQQAEAIARGVSTIAILIQLEGLQTAPDFTRCVNEVAPFLVHAQYQD